MGILTCFFWGGAVRAFLSGPKIETFVMEAWRKALPDWQVELKDPQLILSRGLLPAFGVKFGILRALPGDSCQFEYGAQLVDTYVPISIIGSLSEKKLVFNKVKISQVSLINESQKCIEKVKEVGSQKKSLPSEPLSSSKKPLGLPQKIDFTVLGRAHEKLDKALANFSGQEKIEIQVGEFWWQKQNKILVVHDLNVEKKKVSLELQGHLDFTRWDSIVGEFQKIPFQFSFAQGQGLKVNVDAPFKEGAMVAKVGYQPKQKDPVEFKIDLKYFPFVKLLQMAKVPTSDLELVNVWVNCNIKLLSAESVRRLQLSFEGCELLGTEGEVKAERLSLSWDQKEGLSLGDPALLKISDWPIQNILEMVRREGPSGIFQSFGKLSGEVEVRTISDMELNWKIEDSRLYFSRNGKRGSQLVENAIGSMAFLKGRYSGILTNMNFDQGEFVGSLSFNFGPKFKDGVIQIGIEHLKFHPSIQRLLVNGVLGSLATFGNMSVSEGKLSKWQGEIGVGNVFSKNWKSEKVKMKTLYEKQVFKADIDFEKVLFEKSHAFHAWLSESVKDVLTVKKDLSGPISAKNIKAQLRLQPGEAKVNAPRVMLDQVGVNLVLSADYKKSRLQGQVGFKSSNGKSINYKLIGDPRIWSLKNNKKSYVLFDFEEEKGRGELPPLKEISKKVIESAKKIIPLPSEKDSQAEPKSGQ